VIPTRGSSPRPVDSLSRRRGSGRVRSRANRRSGWTAGPHSSARHLLSSVTHLLPLHYSSGKPYSPWRPFVFASRGLV